MQNVNTFTTEISSDYTDTTLTVNDATIVNESLKKLRDLEADNLTESTVVKTQGRLTLPKKRHKRNQLFNSHSRDIVSPLYDFDVVKTPNI